MTTKTKTDPWAHMMMKVIDGLTYEFVTACPMGGDKHPEGRKVERAIHLKRNGRKFVQFHYVDGTYGPAIQC